MRFWNTLLMKVMKILSGMSYNINHKRKAMKKRNILILIIAIFISTPSVFAQNNDAKRAERNEKIKAMKVAFITNELNLTESEKKSFWPVYNKHEQDEKALREKHKEFRNKFKGKSIDDMTEAEAEELIDNGILLKEQRLELDKSFNADLKSVLPMKKVLKFHKAQRKFKRKLLKIMKGNRGVGKNRKGKFRNRNLE